MKQIVKPWTVTRSPVTWHLRSFFHWHRRSRRPGLPPQMDAREAPVLCPHHAWEAPVLYTPEGPWGLIEWNWAKPGGGSLEGVLVTHSKFEVT